MQNETTRKEWLRTVLSDIPAGKTILDAGAGELANKKFCSHLNYTSQDLCEYNGQGDEKGLHTVSWDTSRIDIVSDICSIPRKDDDFDVVLCSEVLEHLPSPENALVEFHRLLKKGGTLILTAPFCSLTHFAPYHYSTGFNKYYYYYHLEKIGFEIVQMSENGSYFEYLAQEIHRLEFMSQKYCKTSFSRVDRFFISKVLQLLKKISSKDEGSKEALCFGLNVVAKKK